MCVVYPPPRRLGGAGRPRNTAAFPPAPVVTVPCQIMSMSKLDDIIIPGPEIEADPDATALWNQTGNFIGTALARMERGKAFSIMLGRLQQELRNAYGAQDARKVMQAIMETME